MQQLVDDGGLRLAGCVPSHLTLWRLSIWEMGICPVTSSSSAVEGLPAPQYRPIMRRMQELWKVSSWAAWVCMYIYAHVLEGHLTRVGS